MPALTLETPRLLLRPVEIADFEDWAAMMAEEETTRFIGGCLAPAQAWRGFMVMAGCWSLQGFAMFSVVEKATGRWVGRLGPWQPHGWPGTEIGWGVRQEFRGKGYAPEGAAAAMDWAFETLGWTDIIHCIDPDNTASQGVASKLGSVNRGPGKLPPPFEDAPIELWGQTREQWRARCSSHA